MNRARILGYMVAAGLLLVVGGSPFAFGAVHPISYTTFQVATFCLIVLAVIHSVFSAERPAPPQFRWLCVLGGCFGMLAAFQLMGLPSALLRILSPNTLRAVRSALPWKVDVSDIGISLYPLGTQLSVFQYLACFGIFVLVIGLFRSADGRLLLAWSLTGVGVGLALTGLCQHWRSDGAIYGFWQSVYGGASFGPFVNRNHFAGYLGMILPISAALIFIGRSPEERRSPERPARGDSLYWSRIVALCCFLLIFIALVSSLSRGGIISVAVAGCLMSAVAWRKATARRAGLAFAAIFVVGALLGAYYAGPELVERLRGLCGQLTTPLRTSRALATLRTLELFALYPAFGTGLGSFSAVFARVQSPELGLGLYRHAHNDWAQLVAETGVVGVAIALVFVAMLVWLAYGRLRRDGTGSGWWLTLGSSASVAALAVHSAVDFNLHVPSNAFLASAVAGLLCVSAASARRRRRRPPLAHTHPKVALVSVLCVAVAMGAAVHTALTHYLSTALLRRFEPSALHHARRLARANRLSPRDPRPLHMLSGLYAKLAKRKEAGNVERHYREAVKYGQLAIELNPTCSLYHERLAWLRYWGGGSPTKQDRELAEHHFKQAVAFDPAYPDWALSLARFYLKTGRFSKADEYYSRVVVLDPRRTREVAAELASAGTSVERLREVLPETVRAHITLGDYLRQRGDIVEARNSYVLACKLARHVPAAQKSTAALRLARCGEIELAKRHLEAWTRTDGRQLEYLRALAEIAALAGDQEARLRYLETIVRKTPENPQALTALADGWKSAGDWEKALTLYRKAYRLSPRSGRLCDRIVECARRLGRGEEAVEVARNFLLRKPNSARAHFRLAGLLSEQNRVVEALDHYKKAVVLDPANEHYKKELRKAVRTLEELRLIRSGSRKANGRQ